MMAWLPSYFADTLSLNITQAAQLSLLPPVAAIVASSIAGTAGDALITKGMPVVQVRKLAQCTAFLVPALCLTGASLTDDSHLTVGVYMHLSMLFVRAMWVLLCDSHPDSNHAVGRRPFNR